VNPWLAVVLILLLLAASQALLSARRWPSAWSELRRKLLHLEMGGVSLLFPVLFASAWPVVVLAALALLWLAALRSRLLRARFAPALEDCGRGSSGAVWFIAGVCLTFLLSRHDASRYCLAVLVLTLADAAAGIVGTALRRTGKSLEGSLAFFVAALAVSLVILPSVWSALGVALATTLAEAGARRGLDNLSIPMAALAAAIQPYLELENAGESATLGGTAGMLGSLLKS